MVCEGCGTLIVTESELVQGIGGRVSGLVKTSPIPELFDQLGRKKYILEPETAKIDQTEGIKLAIEHGYKNIAVTITLAQDCLKIKNLKKKHIPM